MSLDRRFVRQGIVAVSLLLVATGCVSIPEIPGLGDKVQNIPLQEVGKSVKSQLPIVRKASFGTVKIVGIGMEAGSKPDRLEIPVRFVLTSYEIPEGIDGMVVYEGGLRYSSEDRGLYLAGLKLRRLVFGNSSLEEYVSPGAKRGVAKVVATELAARPIKRMPTTFQATQIKDFHLEKGMLSITFQ